MRVLTEEQKAKQLQMARDYKARNKDKIKMQRAAYYAKNKAKERANHLEWVKKNPAKYKLIKSNSDKQLRIKNADKLKAKRQTQQYRDKFNADRRKKYAEDYNYKISCTLRATLTQAFNLQKVKKSHSIKELIGCTILELKDYLASKFTDGMNWSNYGYGDNKWHIDHIKPCSLFDLSKEEEVRKCFHFTNLRPLWQKENMSKSANYNGNESHINLHQHQYCLPTSIRSSE